MTAPQPRRRKPLLWGSMAGAALALVTVVACQGDMALTNTPFDPNGNGAGTPNGVCTDPAACCTEADKVCWGDIDQGSVCFCPDLWDCSSNPGKCVQTKQVPGTGDWTCSWSPSAYSCTSAGDQGQTPPGGSAGWNCSFANGQWLCSAPFPPNPGNGAGGASQWDCLVNASANQTQCTAKTTGVTPPGTPPGTPPPGTPPPPGGGSEINCLDGIDNDGDGLIDSQDADCPPPNAPPLPPNGITGPGGEICDGKDNNGDGKIDEGNVCQGVAEPCPPGAYQSCDCYCGVHRKCQANGTWGPCRVDGNANPFPFFGGPSCEVAQVISQSQCGPGTVCDFGKCVPGGKISGECQSHVDCPVGKICDLGKCIHDPYNPSACP